MKNSRRLGALSCVTRYIHSTEPYYALRTFYSKPSAVNILARVWIRQS